MSSRVFLLGWDGATWDILRPLMAEGRLPVLQSLMKKGISGTLQSVFPPLSPVAWTTVMTGKNSGKHGIFEFLEHHHNPLQGKVNSSRAIKSELVWETAGRHGRRTVAGGVPMSYPPRPINGFFVGDFLSPADAADFSSDPAAFEAMKKSLGGKYRAWATVTHDGGHEADALADLQSFLTEHLAAVEYMATHHEWDLFMYDLMATDRIQHELWHAWQPTHMKAKGRDLSKIREGFVRFWESLDAGVGRILEKLGPETNVILMSDHGFGPIEWYVNFNVWLLDEGFIKLKKSLYVRQKHWFFRRGVTPEWIYRIMTKLGLADQRVSRFQGKQDNFWDRLATSGFLSGKHIDWSQTAAYAQGNFGQIFLNIKGRQPEGCIEPAEAPALIERIKEKLFEIKHPETGEPLVERVLTREELYSGPLSDMGPDLTVVLKDWNYRTIGLHEFTTHKTISPAFGPTGDHRMEGMIVGTGPAFEPGSVPHNASLLDIAPTVLHLLGVPVPEDMDGRVLTELLRPELRGDVQKQEAVQAGVSAGDYNEDDDAVIQQRLADLGYL
ncbi:MAG: alkaline phosphatase family protein [Isosphaeraceae bacterium]